MAESVKSGGGWEVFRRRRRRPRKNEEFDRFEALTRRLLAVPKDEVVGSPEARLGWAAKHKQGHSS